MVNSLINVQGGLYQGSTNIRKLKMVLFSVKNKKFIKPKRRWGDSVSGYYEYGLYPGTYVVFDYYCWSKGEPMITFEISLVKLEGMDNKYKVEVLKSVKIRADNKSEVLEMCRRGGITKLEILEDFMKSVPAYHICPSIKDLARKIYDEDAVREVIEFLDKYDKQELYEMEVD